MADDKAGQATQPTEGQVEATQIAPGLADVAPVADGSSATERRTSDEWDASKVPPSRFQKRKGSLLATPGSRDGHVDSNKQTKFLAKHTEKGYHKMK